MLLLPLLGVRNAGRGDLRGGHDFGWERHVGSVRWGVVADPSVERREEKEMKKSAEMDVEQEYNTYQNQMSMDGV
jgi:hypothetical protein